MYLEKKRVPMPVNTDVAATSQRQAPSADRLTGAAGLVFLGLVIVQNVIKAATDPPNDADPARLQRFADHQAWTVHVLVVTHVLGYPALLLLAAGLGRRAVARHPAAEIWARVGQFSAVVVAVPFGLLNVLQVTTVARDALAHQPDTPVVLWTLHNAIFALNLLAVAGALLGLSRAAALSGLIPRPLARIALVGAALLALASAPAVAEVHGSKLLGAGIVGFLVWLACLAVVCVKLLTAPAASRLGREAPQATPEPF